MQCLRLQTDRAGRGVRRSRSGQKPNENTHRARSAHRRTPRPALSGCRSEHAFHASPAPPSPASSASFPFPAPQSAAVRPQKDKKMILFNKTLIAVFRHMRYSDNTADSEEIRFRSSSAVRTVARSSAAFRGKIQTQKAALRKCRNERTDTTNKMQKMQNK